MRGMRYSGLRWNKARCQFFCAFADHIELSDDMMAIPTEMRRNDKCFIVTPDKSHLNFSQSLPSHLLFIWKVVQDDDGMLNKVAFAEKTNVLKDIMLEQWKKLFTQMESGEGVTVVERKKKSKTFCTFVLQFFCRHYNTSGRIRKHH